MKILADLHISPATVLYLRSLGHDVIRVNDILDCRASDSLIIQKAALDERTIITQDLDFSALLAVEQRKTPSVISLRLASPKIDHVNAILQRILPELEADVREGVIVSVTSKSMRKRNLPIK